MKKRCWMAERNKNHKEVEQNEGRAENNGKNETKRDKKGFWKEKPGALCGGSENRRKITKKALATISEPPLKTS